MRCHNHQSLKSIWKLHTVKCRYNAVLGVQEIDRVIAAGFAMDVFWRGIREIQPANCQMTTADVAAIAMIRNNAVWIHGLIKHCLRSWTDKFGHFYACVREMTGQGPPAPRKHVNNFRCDLFRDAGKTTRSGAMNTERITIPRSKLRKYCRGQLCQVLRMFIRAFSFTIA